MRDTVVIGDKVFERDRMLREALGFSAATQWRWIRSGRLPEPLKLGNLSYFNRREVEEVLLSRRK